MEKINIKELNLLVASREVKLPDNEWLYNAINLLLTQRVSHCRNALNTAIERDEAFLMNHCDSQIVIFKSKAGNIYGHFSEPTYNNMIEYLNNTGALYMNQGIVQQSLRQYFFNIHYSNYEREEVKTLLEKYNKDENHLEEALTEIMLVM